MSDPVAEAAAQIAEQHADVIPQESAQEVGTAAGGEQGNVLLTDSAEQAGGAAAAEGSTTTADDLGNVDASTLPAGAATSAATDGEYAPPADLVALGIKVDSPESEAAARQWLIDKGYTKTELPNVASVADDHTTAQDYAPNADGANTTLPIAASSAEPPLHMRIAMHLEAIYTMAREEVEAAPKEAAEQAQTVKTHIGDVLHRISNGMSVAEGELVQKLEALYRVL